MSAKPPEGAQQRASGLLMRRMMLSYDIDNVADALRDLAIRNEAPHFAKAPFNFDYDRYFAAWEADLKADEKRKAAGEPVYWAKKGETP